MILIDMKLSVLFVLLLGSTCHRAEGLCSVENCTNLTRCILSKDQRSCRCAHGYYDDQCDKNARIKVMCGRDYMSVQAMEDFFQYHNVPLEALHLTNTSCRAQREMIDGVSYYMSRITKEQYVTCVGTPPEKNLTHISYSMSLMSDPQVIGNIIREPVIKLNIKCLYPYNRRVSLAFPIIPLSSESVVHIEELDATIHMMLYTDQHYTKAYTSAPTIELRNKVYVEVAITEPEDFFLLRVNKCWATQSAQPDSLEGMVHTLLLHGCVDDQTVSFVNVSQGQSGHNGESSTVRYSFDMFRFTAVPHDLYLHCTVQLCEPDIPRSCKPNCNSMRKREAVREEPSHGLLSYGPIRIEMPDTRQSSILTTVVLPVAGVWTVAIFLVILISVAKAGSRRLVRTGEH